MAEIDLLLFHFVWSSRKHLVSKETLIQPLAQGGLKMPSVEYVVKTAKIMWIKRMTNNIQTGWKVMAEELMGMSIRELSENKLFVYVKPRIKTAYYSDLLSIWFDFLKPKLNNINDLIHQKLFNNPAFTINRKIISAGSREWEVAGFTYVSDILQNDNKFRSKLDIERRFSITISDMQYNQLVSVITSKLRILPKHCHYTQIDYYEVLPMKCLDNFSKITSAQIYRYFLSQGKTTPTSQNKWIEYYPFLETLEWKNVYLLPSKIVQDTYLITLQFKILHRVFACNYKLFIWKIKDTPNCTVCDKIDNLEHYFYYCTDTYNFWRQVQKWLCHLLSYYLSLTILEVLLGVINCDPRYYYIINYVIIIGKYYISQSKKKQKDISFFNFLHTLKQKLRLDERVHIKQDCLPRFVEKFGILSDSI